MQYDASRVELFAILQKYDFSSKSQQEKASCALVKGCLRYCKSTIFQANHNASRYDRRSSLLFAILQKYDFSSKSQHNEDAIANLVCCLRYCKSTIFQANHNEPTLHRPYILLFAILQKYDFSSKSQRIPLKLNSQ